MTSTEDLPTVSGGPESLLPLLESGTLDADTPTVLAGDGGLPGAREWLVTDGLRHRERNVGRVRDNLSQTLTASERPRQGRPSTDVLPFRGRDHLTTAAYRGIRGVDASTSISFADAAGGSDPSGLPFAAVDGDPLTAWRSSSFVGPDGQWLEVELDTPREVSSVDLSIVDDLRVGWPVTRVRLTTDAGSTEHDVARGEQPQRFRGRAGADQQGPGDRARGRGEPADRQRRHRRAVDPRRHPAPRAAGAGRRDAVGRSADQLRVLARLAAEVRVRRTARATPA